MSSSTKKNQKTTPWSVVKFILIIVVAAAFGGAMSMVTMFNREGLLSATIALQAWAGQWMLPLRWTTWAVLAAICTWLYLSARGMVSTFLKAEGEDDKLACLADLRLSWVMALSNISMILCYTMVFLEAILPQGSLGDIWWFISATVGFMTLIQTLTVQQVKRLDPLKRGDPLSFSFDKQWMASCDEAEKLDIYRCAYASYKATMPTLLVLWVVAILGGVTFDTGVFPVLLTSAAALVQMGSFQLHAIQLSKKRYARK